MINRYHQTLLSDIYQRFSIQLRDYHSDNDRDAVLTILKQVIKTEKDDFWAEQLFHTWPTPQAISPANESKKVATMINQATGKEQVIGFLQFTEKEGIKIDYVFIDETLRGKGIGKALLLLPILTANNQQKDIILISTPNSKSYYLHLGFKKLQDLTSQEDDTLNDITASDSMSDEEECPEESAEDLVEHTYPTTMDMDESIEKYSQDEDMTSSCGDEFTLGLPQSEYRTFIIENFCQKTPYLDAAATKALFNKKSSLENNIFTSPRRNSIFHTSPTSSRRGSLSQQHYFF